MVFALMMAIACGGGAVATEHVQSQSRSAVLVSPEIVFHRMHNEQTDLARAWTRLSGYTLEFQITQNSHLFMMGHVNIEHKNMVNGPVAFALCISLKKSDTQGGLEFAPPDFPWFNIIHGTKTGGTSGTLLIITGIHPLMVTPCLPRVGTGSRCGDLAHLTLRPIQMGWRGFTLTRPRPKPGLTTNLLRGSPRLLDYLNASQ